jgi:hypothetical protein
MSVKSEIKSIWTIDPDGYIISPSGSKVARLQGDTLMFYDKKMRVSLPFLMSDWAFLRQRMTTINSERTENLDRSAAVTVSLASEQ